MFNKLFSFSLLLIAASACAQPKPREVDACEDCDLMFAGIPSSLSWETKINEPTEPGEPLVITGKIYQNDGKTPAPNVILYVYHTDNTGEYTPGKNQTKARRHGHLRGWVKTDAQGRYKFTTIRPAHYPGRQAAAHIHPIIQETDGRYYWIDEYLFEDDPLVTTEVRQREQKRGGNGIIALKKVNGIWEGTRDIVLGLNIPGY